MKPLRPLSARATTIVDQTGLMLADPATRTVLGTQPIPPLAKLIYALATNTQSGINDRYLPAHPPTESCVFGIDYSSVIPLGVGISSGTLDIFENVVPPVEAADDFTIGTVTVLGRALYATLSGGVDGTDYMLRWTATDTQGNVWPRTGLCLCAQTS
jgi:hypothetical protein